MHRPVKIGLTISTHNPNTPHQSPRASHHPDVLNLSCVFLITTVSSEFLTSLISSPLSFLTTFFICRKFSGQSSMTVSVSVASSLPSSPENQDRRPKSRSLASHSANFEQPAAILQPSLLGHSCISFCAKCIVPKNRPVSHSLILARFPALVAPLPLAPTRLEYASDTTNSAS